MTVLNFMLLALVAGIVVFVAVKNPAWWVNTKDAAKGLWAKWNEKK